MEAVAAYPLCWPSGRPRTTARKRALFKVPSFTAARAGLLEELERMKAANPILSTWIKLRLDGSLVPSQKYTDPGVAVYFDYKGKQVCFACDRWTLVEDNIHAITLTINALRGISRWGTGDMVDAAFAGFTALPAPSESWQTTLGVPFNATLDQAEESYSRLAMIRHPDRGGTHESMAKLNEAIERARKELA